MLSIDATMLKCAVYTLLRLENLLLNVYGSFGHTSVIAYWCVDNYGYHSCQNDLYCIDVTHHTLWCWSEPEYENNDIHVYALVLCVCDR